MNNKRRKTLLRIAVLMVILVASVTILLNSRQIAFDLMNLVSEPYDKDFHETNFESVNGVIYRIDLDTGKQYPVLRHLSDGYEGATDIGDLIGLERGWTNFTIQSPAAPTVADYVELSHQILEGERSFLDNRVEPSNQRARSGQQSLMAVAVVPDNGEVSKASLSSTLLYFVKGDHVRFSSWYYFEKVGDFNTLMDLESTLVRGHPGMRIRLNHGYLDFELAKWMPNPIYRQPEDNRIPFPIGQWVHVEAHLFLSDLENGIVQLWQDNQLIIDARGQTLPFADAVYDVLEIGLSAHSFGPDSAILFVDDLIISTGQIE